MPDTPMPNSLEGAWLAYVQGLKGLLVPQSDDRPLDQYLVFRDAVLPLVQGEVFLRELRMAWPVPNGGLPPELADALLIELRAFPLAAEVAQATEKPEERKGGWRSLLERAGTVCGSVKDLLANLPPYARNALTLLKELIDIFKARG